MTPNLERAKLEIRADIAAGVVAAEVASFAELHDYADANEYGGAAELVCGGVWSLEDADELQGLIDDWIKAEMPD